LLTVVGANPGIPSLCLGLSQPQDVALSSPTCGPASFGDNALVYVQNNGVNSVSVDLPNYTPGNLHINHNPRNGLPCFNTSLFTPNPLGTQANTKRRLFYGPGINNFDVALHKITKLTETKLLEFRLVSDSPCLLAASAIEPPVRQFE